MFKLTTAAAAALLAAAACPAQGPGQAGEPPQPQRDLAMEAESRVLNLLRTSNQAEIRAAELVLERTRSDTVRRFADRLLRDHRLADERTDDVASAKGIVLAPISFNGQSAAAGAPPAPPGDAETMRSHEADDLYRQPMGQSPSLATRQEDQRTPGRLSADPMQRQQGQTVAWDLPQISEPPSADQVLGAAPAAGEQRPSQESQPQSPARPEQGAAAPRVTGGGASPSDRGAERPLDLNIARLKAERMLRELEAAGPDSIDAVYTAAMIKSHDDTVQSLRTGVASVADDEVADLVGDFIPILEQHARMARHVQRQLGGAAVADEQTETPGEP